MELITQGFTILLLLLVLNASPSFARPSGEEGDAATAASTNTTPESIEAIFRKYDQEYPFHGGNSNSNNNNGDERNVQNDAPVMEAIIERLNEIINDDQPSKFIAPNADVSEQQRSLLRKQKDDLVFGHGRINRRVKESLNRENAETYNSGLLNLDQNPFFNKDLLADSYYNRPADRFPAITLSTTRRPFSPSSRAPVRTSTRFPNRQTSSSTSWATKRTTTTVAPGHHFQETAAGEKITELITDGLLTKPEGNKLSIPVLSVATEDFEEDLPQKPVIVTKPSKVTAQTDDFDDASRNQYENYRRQAPLIRKRREPYDSWLSRVSSWFNFYGETEGEEVEQGRKLSALIKRQIPSEEEKDLTPTVAAEPVPIPEEVKSVDTPPQVSDAVIETILDIDDPQTRSEFAKDVPAIEVKLEQLEEEAEANQQTVEVAIVELGKTEPEELGRVLEEKPAINESRQLAVESISEGIEKLDQDVPVETPKEEVVPEMKVLRDQIPDDFSRSGNPPPAKIIDVIAAIPSEIVSVMTTSETIRDVPEEDNNSARSIEPVAVVQNEIPSDVEEKLAFIEVDRVVPIVKSNFTPVQSSESIPTPIPQDQVAAENITTTLVITEPSVIPISHTMLVDEKIVPEGDHEAKLIKIAVEGEKITHTLQSITTIAAAVEIPSKVSTDELVVVSEVKPRTEDMELVIEDRRPQFENPEVALTVDDTKISSTAAAAAAVPQTKTPIVVEQEQDFDIVIEPEADDEPVPKSLDVNIQLPAVATVEPENTKTTITVGRTELKNHVVEEAVLITVQDSVMPEQAKTLEDPSVPLISENVDSRLNSMIIAEVLEDENMEVGYNSIVPTTILPLDWLKEEFSGAGKSSSSGSDSNSMSTTESSSDAEQLATTSYGSSEEEDDGSRERDAEKERRKEEKRRLKEEERRLKKEAEQRRKADEKEKDNSSEEVKATEILSDPAEKLTKEEMVNVFSSPEMEIDLRRLDTAPAAAAATTERVIIDPVQVISEVAETQKNISSDHVVIKKDGVEIEDDDDSAESGEVTTITPELLEQLNEALDHEMQEVEKVLEVLENALGETIKTDTAAAVVVDTDVAEVMEQSNSVITSKNTRHLVKVGYSDDFIEKDNLPDVAEARLGGYPEAASDTAAFNEYNSRAFVLIGSGLFLVIGFVLFALVVLLVKRTRRYGSLDLTVQA